MCLLIPCIIHRLIHRFIIVMSIKNERRKRFLNLLMERYLACPRNINGCPRLAAFFTPQLWYLCLEIFMQIQYILLIYPILILFAIIYS